jgi:hypothetical protein
VVSGSLDASTTVGAAIASGDFDTTGAAFGWTTGATVFNAEIGGLATIKGQAQATGTVESSSVNGASTATIGSLTAGGFSGDEATLVGLSGLSLDGDAAGSILGTAAGTFNASANSVGGNAIAWAAESLTGINAVNITLDGAGTINAIVTNTSFVDAQSVGGTATATSSIDAVALNVATITVGADLMLTGSTTVNSTTNAQSV